ncbi:hypothetical protein HDV62DRAFT_399081 [Trichoderma sp. SZMC 28011]
MVLTSHAKQSSTTATAFSFRLLSLDTGTRNTYTALGSLQLKTLPRTQRDIHAHHQATSPRLAPEECKNQFGDLAFQIGCEYLCFRNCYLIEPFGLDDSSLNSIPNAESSGKASTETTDGFPHFEGKMPWVSGIQDEEISISLTFAFVSSTLPLPAACPARPQNFFRQPPQSVPSQLSRPSSAFGQLTQTTSVLFTPVAKLCLFEIHGDSGDLAWIDVNPFNFPKGTGPSPLDATLSFRLEV